MPIRAAAELAARRDRPRPLSGQIRRRLSNSASSGRRASARRSAASKASAGRMAQKDVMVCGVGG